MISITLPWPPRVLHPNSRTHWGLKARVTAGCRSHAGWLAKEAGIRRGDPDIPERLKATITFHPPDKRRRDLDGMLSSVKAHLDGIADALGVDDSKWDIAINRGEPRKGGAVVVELSDATLNIQTREGRA